jgi:flagellar FliJ protein
MANLDPLIKLRKFKLEDMQKSLAVLYREAESIETRKQNYLMVLEHERSALETSNDVMSLTLFNNYADRIKKVVEELNDDLSIVNARIDVAREEMREAFAEMKKIEIVRDNRKAEERAVRDKKESDTLDEVGVMRAASNTEI